jgi:hypothetical protein
MRTTVDIHDPLLERAKALASASGRRLADVINDALREMLSRRQRQESGADKDEDAMPVSEVAGRGLRPGMALTSNGDLLEAMDDLPSPGVGGGPGSQTDGLR